MAKSPNTKSATKKLYPVKKSTDNFDPGLSKTDAIPAGSESGLQKLFLDAIKDIYWAENALVKSLPKLISSSASAELQSALTDHLQVTKEHVSRLESIFNTLGKKPQAKKCDAMEGLSKEAEAIIETTDSGSAARDQGIIMAAQKTEHYEIATYTGLSKLATALGYNEAAGILGTTLADELEADQILASLAEDALSDYSGAAKNG